MEVTLRIKRYNPDVDLRPAFKEYQVEATDRLLDALNKIKWFQDRSLTYRRSCAHGICGSDAMKVNGRNRLACKLLLGDLGQTITIEPLIGFPVIKDFVVDMEPFFARYRSINPYLIANDSPIHGERRQSPEQRERYDDTSKYILCTASPALAQSPGHTPATAVRPQSSTLTASSSTVATQVPTSGCASLDGNTGVWCCRTIFNCTEVCPRGIQMTRAIAEVKRAFHTVRFE